jgi:hypothetical protein
MFSFVPKVSVTGLIAQILLINAVVVCLAEKQTTSAAVAAATVDHAHTAASRQVLLIHHVASRTSSITISWATNSSHSSYQVRARSLLSGITLTGQPTNETEYTLTDLMIDTPYDVCVTAKATEAAPVTAESRDEGKAVEEEEACLQVRTIPSVRVDSVLVLFGVISFIVLSVAAALVCWKCSQKSDDAEPAADATASDYKDDANEVDGGSGGVPEADIRKNQDEAARPLLATIGKADKVKGQPEVEFVVSAPPPQSSNNLQSNEVSAEQKSDGPTLV